MLKNEPLSHWASGNFSSIWPTRIIAPKQVRTPRGLLSDSVDVLNRSDSPFKAEISPERKGERDAYGNPTKRTDLVLIDIEGRRRVVATVEYPKVGYPASLIVGEGDALFLSISSEEELVSELRKTLSVADLR